MEDLNSGDLTELLLADTIGVVGTYMDHIQKLHPLVVAVPQSTAPSEDDSQNSLGMDVNMDRHMMIFVRWKTLYPTNANLISRSSKRFNRPLVNWCAKY